MNLEILNGFDRMPDVTLDGRGNDITTAMTGNLNFPGPVPALDAAKAALTAFTEARIAAQNGDRVAVAIKNQKRLLLITALHQLGDYVLFTAKGNLAVALSSGFKTRKANEPKPPITKPENFVLVNGVNPGEMLMSVTTVKGAKMYLFQYTTDAVITPDSKWITISSSRAKILARGLTSNQMIWGRVVALGTNGQEVYSDPVCRMVL